MQWLDEVLPFIPDGIKSELMQLTDREKQQLTEIRICANQRLLAVVGKSFLQLNLAIKQCDMQGLLSRLTGYSALRHQQTLNAGFFTLSGGHRVGVAGRMVDMGDGKFALKDIGAICIRIARQVTGCADKIMPVIMSRHGRIRNTLIISPPGMGKTTLLRDIARQLANNLDNPIKVSVVDERSELAACVDGVPQFDLGISSICMDGCPKDIGIFMMLRSLAPDVIITDEIGSARDADAIYEALRCGIKLIASAHATNIEELYERRIICKLIESGSFDLIIELDGLIIGKVLKIHNMEEVISGA